MSAWFFFTLRIVHKSIHVLQTFGRFLSDTVCAVAFAVRTPALFRLIVFSLGIIFPLRIVTGKPETPTHSRAV